MSSWLGLELGPRSIRAVLVGGLPRRHVRSLSFEWDPEQPARAMTALSEAVGRAGRVFAAVDLSLLRVKHLDLPPVSSEQKRRILALEPERFFAVRGEELAFAVEETDNVVFALPEPLLAAWNEALARLGPVERIEPGPIARARALARAGVKDGLVLAADSESSGLVALTLGEGQLRGARRVFGDPRRSARSLIESARTGTTRPEDIYVLQSDPEESDQLGELIGEGAAEAVPRLGAVEPSHLGAYGATLEPERWQGAILTAELERSSRRRHRFRLALAVGTCLGALLFVATSVDTYRARSEARLDERIAVLESAAGPALTLRETAESLAREVAAVADIEAERLDLLSALLEISRRMPTDAWIRSVQVAPPDWVIDGYARDAAALIPLFEEHPRFEDVQFRSATSRAQIGNDTYENFSVALRAVRTP